MRVVLLGTEFNMTGAALLLFRWAVHLRRRGHDIVAVHDANVTGPLRDAYQAEGIELSERFDVDGRMLVICNTVMAARYVLQTAPTARTVWWIHEGEVGLPILVKNPGAGRAFAAAPAADPSTDRPIRVITVGSIYPRKRQADLIRAIARLSDLPLECLLVGGMVQLEKDAVDLFKASPGRFAFTGQIAHAEALRLIGRADIFSLPSGSECLPIAPLEAGQRGRAVLLSDLPAHEGVWRHGVNCLMHQAGDVDLLAHLLRVLATDAPLRARLGAAARRTAAGYRNDMFLARLDMVLASLA
jgi:glycosyltransferase involved in cell wall biosynthesis